MSFFACGLSASLSLASTLGSSRGSHCQRRSFPACMLRCAMVPSAPPSVACACMPRKCALSGRVGSAASCAGPAQAALICHRRDVAKACFWRYVEDHRHVDLRRRLSLLCQQVAVLEVHDAATWTWTPEIGRVLDSKEAPLLRRIWRVGCTVLVGHRPKGTCGWWIASSVHPAFHSRSNWPIVACAGGGAIANPLRCPSPSCELAPDCLRESAVD